MVTSLIKKQREIFTGTQERPVRTGPIYDK